MRGVRRAAVIVALPFAIAACGGDDGGGPGSTPGAFACLGAALPTTAPNPVVVTGVVQANAIAPAPLADAKVVAFKTGTATALDSTVSGAAGTYSLSLATAGLPLDGYVRVTKATYLDTYGYPPLPIAANASQSVLLATSGERTALSFAAGVTVTAGTGLIVVIVTDCNGTALAGATVSSNPGGTVKYNSGGLPSAGASSTASDGIAYIFNVTAGDVLVSATASSHTLLSHTVNARADVVTLTGIAPGPSVP